MGFEFLKPARTGRTVAEIEGLRLSAGGKPLLDGASLKEVLPFVVLVLTLMVRPYGLFGTREVERL